LQSKLFSVFLFVVFMVSLLLVFLEMLQSVFAAYANALHDHPLLVKMITSISLSFLGDLIAQSLEYFCYGHVDSGQEELEVDKEKIKERKPWKWNRRRSFSMGIFGGIWGFTAHYWYHYLDLLGYHVYPENLDKQIILKLVIDMLIFLNLLLWVFILLE